MLFMKRATNRTTTIVSLLALLIFMPFLLLGMGRTVEIILRAAGKSADILVDAKAVFEPIDTSFYHAFAQGGEEATDMLAPVLGEIRSLNPRLIRLDHIYDHYEVVGRSGSDLTFDWSRLDGAVNTILAAGAKPVLALSYMPPAIARDGNRINPPNDWNEWALVVERTIEHFSGRGGRNLSGIYYEVWNEPDLEQFGSWKLGGEKNYLTLYQYSAIGAKNAQNVNAFSIGGPATTGLYKNWVIALASSGMRVDFFSWHSYLPNPKRFDSDQRNLVSWLIRYPTHVLKPTLITEAGFTGAKDARYGTTYAAAHTAAMVRQMIPAGPSYVFTFQPKDGPTDDSQGWGFITHETKGKKLKPRYYVYSFLDTMAGNRLELTGEGTWVTAFASKKDTTIRVLLVNFDAGGNHVESVPVTITNLEPGAYSFRERLLLGRDTTTHEIVTKTTITKKVYMPAQSVAIVELTRE